MHKRILAFTLALMLAVSSVNVNADVVLSADAKQSIMDNDDISNEYASPPVVEDDSPTVEESASFEDVEPDTAPAPTTEYTLPEGTYFKGSNLGMTYYDDSRALWLTKDGRFFSTGKYYPNVDGWKWKDPNPRSSYDPVYDSPCDTVGDNVPAFERLKGLRFRYIFYMYEDSICYLVDDTGEHIYVLNMYIGRLCGRYTLEKEMLGFYYSSILFADNTYSSLSCGINLATTTNYNPGLCEDDSFDYSTVTTNNIYKYIYDTEPIPNYKYMLTNFSRTEPTKVTFAWSTSSNMSNALQSTKHTVTAPTTILNAVPYCNENDWGVLVTCVDGKSYYCTLKDVAVGAEEFKVSANYVYSVYNSDRCFDNTGHKVNFASFVPSNFYPEEDGSCTTTFNDGSLSVTFNAYHTCTFDTCNVTFDASDLEGDVAREFTCTCGKTYLVKPSDFNRGFQSMSPSIIVEQDCRVGVGTFGYAYNLSGCVKLRDIPVVHDLDASDSKTEIKEECNTSRQTIIYNKCTKCGEYIKVKTNYGSWVSHDFSDLTLHHVKEPTCTEDGIYSILCTKCNSYADDQYYYDNIPEGDKPDGFVSYYSDPSNGKYGFVYIIPHIGHAIDTSSSQTTATCSQNGITTGVCKHCGEPMTIRSLALGHDYICTHDKYPTCQEEGIDTFTCSRCGDTYTEPVDIIDHNWELTSTDDPTCIDPGVNHYTCSMCGNTKDENIPALQHDYESVVNGDDVTYTCKRCHDTFTQKVVSTSNYVVECSDKRLAVFNKSTGEVFFTGPNSAWEGPTEDIYYEAPAEESVEGARQYGKRQIRRALTSSQGVTFSNANYQVGTPATYKGYFESYGYPLVVKADDKSYFNLYTGISCRARERAKLDPPSHSFPNGMQVLTVPVISASGNEDMAFLVGNNHKLYYVDKAFHTCSKEYIMENGGYFTIECGKEFQKVDTCLNTSAALSDGGDVYRLSHSFLMKNRILSAEHDRKVKDGEYSAMSELSGVESENTDGSVKFKDLAACGDGRVCAIDTSGYLRYIDEKGAYSDKLNDTMYTMIDGGYDHFIAIDIKGNVWAWGKNTFWQLGLDADTETPVDRAEPTQVTNGKVFVNVSAGNQISAMIDVAGNLYVAGHNNLNQLGLCGDAINSARGLVFHSNLAHIHHYEKSSYTVESSGDCTTDGYIVRRCTTCGEEERISRPGTGHLWARERFDNIKISPKNQKQVQDTTLTINGKVYTTFDWLPTIIKWKDSDGSTHEQLFSWENTVSEILAAAAFRPDLPDSINKSFSEVITSESVDTDGNAIGEDLAKFLKTSCNARFYTVPAYDSATNYAPDTDNTVIDFTALSNVDTFEKAMATYYVKVFKDCIGDTPINDVLKYQQTGCSDGTYLVHYVCRACGATKDVEMQNDHVVSATGVQDYNGDVGYVSWPCKFCGEVIKRRPKQYTVTFIDTNNYTEYDDDYTIDKWVNAGLNAMNGTRCNLADNITYEDDFALPDACPELGSTTTRFIGANVGKEYKTDIVFEGYLEDKLFPDRHIHNLNVEDGAPLYFHRRINVYLRDLDSLVFTDESKTTVDDAVEIHGHVAPIGWNMLSKEYSSDSEGRGVRLVSLSDKPGVSDYKYISENFKFAAPNTSMEFSIYDYIKSGNTDTTIMSPVYDWNYDHIRMDYDNVVLKILAPPTNITKSGYRVGTTLKTVKVVDSDNNVLATVGSDDWRGDYDLLYTGYNSSDYKALYLDTGKNNLTELNKLLNGQWVVDSFTYNSRTVTLTVHDSVSSIDFDDLGDNPELQITNLSDLHAGTKFTADGLSIILNDNNESEVGKSYENTLDFEMDCDDEDVKAVFEKRMSSNVTIPALSKECNKLINIEGNVTGLIFPYDADSAEVVKLGGRDIIDTGLTTSCDLADSYVSGKLVYDVKRHKLRVLANNKFYDPTYIYGKRYIAGSLIGSTDPKDQGNDYTVKYFDSEFNIKEAKVTYTYDSGSYKVSSIQDTSSHEDISSTTYLYEGDIYKLNVYDCKYLVSTKRLLPFGFSHILYDGSKVVYLLKSNNIYTEVIPKSDKYLAYAAYAYKQDPANKDIFSEALLINSIINKDTSKIEKLVDAKSFIMLNLPSEKEMKRDNFYIENYEISSIDAVKYNNIDLGDRKITVKPNWFELDTNVTKAYEYQDASISAEALRNPDNSEWYSKYFADSKDFLKIRNKLASAATGDIYDAVYTYDESMDKGTINLNILGQTMTEDPIVSPKIYVQKYSNGKVYEITNSGALSTKVSDAADEDKWLNGEHVIKASTAYNSSGKEYADFMAITEEGGLWASNTYSTSNNPVGSLIAGQETEDYGYSVDHIGFGREYNGHMVVKYFPDIHFVDYVTCASGGTYLLDEDGRIWCAKLKPKESYDAYSTALVPINNPSIIKAKSLPVLVNDVSGSYSTPFYFIGEDNNIWYYSFTGLVDHTWGGDNYLPGLEYGGSTAVGDNYLDRNGSLYSISPYANIAQVTSSGDIKQIGLNRYLGIYAIDFNNDLLCMGVKDPGRDSLFYVVNGVYQSNTLKLGDKLYTGSDADHAQYGSFYSLTKLDDICPYFKGVKWDKILCGSMFNVNEWVYNATEEYLNFLDTTGRLWQVYDDRYGFVVTDTNVKDGAGNLTITRDNKLHLRRRVEKEDASFESTVLFGGEEFSEVGDMIDTHLKTTSGKNYIPAVERVFAEGNQPLKFNLKNFIYENIIPQGGTSYNSGRDDWTTYVPAFYRWCQNPNDDLKLEGGAELTVDFGTMGNFVLVNPELLDTKRYDVDINLADLYAYDNVKFEKGDRILVSFCNGDTIYKVTDASVRRYGDVSTFITDDNVTDTYDKLNTPVTNNTLTLRKVSRDLDGATYYLKSTYNDEADTSYYSDPIRLDVTELESVTATYPEPVLINTYADPDKVEVTLNYADGYSKSVSYNDLTDVPDDGLLVSDYDNKYTVGFNRFDNVDLDIEGTDGILSATATYPEQVFKGEEFDHAKLDVQYCLASDPDTWYKVTNITESNIVGSDLTVSKVGENTFTVSISEEHGYTYEVPVTIIGYYYDTLTATYTGDPVTVGKYADLNKVKATLSYTDDLNADDSRHVEHAPISIHYSARTTTDPTWKLADGSSMLPIDNVGNNDFDIVLNDDAEITGSFTVTGKDYIKSLIAENIGDVEVDKSVSKGSIVVKPVYAGAGEQDALNANDFTISGTGVSDDGNDVFVRSLGLNSYTVSYGSLTTTVYANGIDWIEGIEAEYIGDIVPFYQKYAKSEVAVHPIYHVKKKSPFTLPTSAWKVKDTDLTVDEETESDTAVYEGFESDYTVPGVLTPMSLEAVYTGDDIKVGNVHSTDYVTVTVFYDKEKQHSEVVTDWTKPADLTVNKVGTNTYLAEYGDLSATYTVNGYKEVDHITATYTREEPTPIGQTYSKGDVVVMAYYDAEGTDGYDVGHDWKVVTSDEAHNLRDSLTVDALEITDCAKYVDPNFPAHVFYADYNVTGITKVIKSIDAEYMGNPVTIGSEHDRSYVKVTVNYEDGDYKVLDSADEWNTVEDSLQITVVGNNDFTASYEGFTDLYTVPGQKVPHHIKAEHSTTKDYYVDDKYAKSEVTVTLYYDEAETDSRVLKSNEWHVEDEDLTLTNSPATTDKACYENLTADYTVKAMPKPSAVYKGKPIIAGKEFSKDDVVYKLKTGPDTYTTFESGEWYNHNNTVDGCDHHGTYDKDDKCVNSADSNGRHYAVPKDAGAYTADKLKAEFTVPTAVMINLTAAYTGQDIKFGSSYSKDDVQVKAIYNNGVAVPIASTEWTADPEPLKPEKHGLNRYTANYANMSAQYYVPVIAVPVGITATGNGISKVVGTNYEKSDVTISLIYSDGTAKPLGDSDWDEANDDYTIRVEGDNTYTAKYGKFTADYTLNGLPTSAPRSIETTYHGPDIPTGEEYDKDDVVVMCTFMNNNVIQLGTNDWTESGLTVTKKGDNTFTASYSGLTDSYVVTGTVVEKQLTAKYNGDPVLTGSDYDKDDVTVNLIYHDGSSVSVNSVDWEASSVSVNSVGKNPYVATYHNFNASYYVDGYRDVVGIKSTYVGDPVEVGKQYDKSDVIVDKLYHDGTKSTISANDWEPSSLDVTKPGENKFTATYDKYSSEYTVKGYDKPTPTPTPTPSPSPTPTPTPSPSPSPSPTPTISGNGIVPTPTPSVVPTPSHKPKPSKSPKPSKEPANPSRSPEPVKPTPAVSATPVPSATPTVSGNGIVHTGVGSNIPLSVILILAALALLFRAWRKR